MADPFAEFARKIIEYADAQGVPVDDAQRARAELETFGDHQAARNEPAPGSFAAISRDIRRREAEAEAVRLAEEAKAYTTAETGLEPRSLGEFAYRLAKFAEQKGLGPRE